VDFQKSLLFTFPSTLDHLFDVTIYSPTNAAISTQMNLKQVLTMNSSHSHIQLRQRRRKGQLKSEVPSLLQFMFLVIVGLNTMIISFLSLFQHNVAHVKFRRLEQTFRNESPTLPMVRVPQVKFVRKSPIAKVSTGTVVNNTTSTGSGSTGSSNLLELKCRDHRAWKEDPIWRDAVLRPQVCTTTNDISSSLDEQVYLQKQSALLNETIFSSNADFTPCGVYCLYHLDSAFSYQYGHPIYGWELRVHENQVDGSKDNKSQKTECWEPFSSQTEDSPCVVHYYNDWIGYVEDVEVKQRKLPVYNQHSGIDYHINPKIIQEQMDEFQPKCSNGGEPVDSFYTSSTAPFCHFRSYDGGNSLSIRKMHDFDVSSLEFRRNLKPSEIVHLFDREQLGIDELSDALSLMTETFAHFNASSCDAKDLPEQVLLCAYHRQSSPRTAVVPGQYGSKVPIKGWQYRTMDKCFIPVENMEYSSTCGRRSDQYKVWSQHMLDRQQKMQLEESHKEQADSALTKCDRLPLTLGRNTWNSDADKYEYLPPLPTTEPPLDGAKYSEGSICGPRLLIIGAAQCGTNAIGTLLSHHPRVKMNRCHENETSCDFDHFLADEEFIWENHGLSYNYEIDRHNYKAKYAQKLPVTEEYDYTQLPNGTTVVGSGSLTFDKSPSYLNTEIFPNIADRAKQMLPNAKIVVSLCNPVARMYSEFHHTLTDNRYYYELFFNKHNVPVPSSFTEMVNYMKFSADICNKKPTFCEELRRDKLRTGIFHQGIKAWRNAFGAENVLVLNMDESDMDKIKKVTTLMGDFLPETEYPWEKLDDITTSLTNKFDSDHYSGILEDKLALEWLRGYFYRHNVALADEIDAEWPILWNQNPTQQAVSASVA
jgi:Sulfotransferase family